MNMADRNRYLVLHGWSEHASFTRFQDAVLFRAFMQELCPKWRFDIWLETEAAKKDRVMLSEGSEPVREPRHRLGGIAALMRHRDNAKRSERRTMRTWERNI